MLLQEHQECCIIAPAASDRCSQVSRRWTMTQDKAFFESPDSKLQDDVSGLLRAARLPAQLENIIGRRYVLRFGEARRALCGTITGVYIETDGDGNMTLMELQVSNPGALPGVTIRCLR